MASSPRWHRRVPANNQLGTLARSVEEGVELGPAHRDGSAVGQGHRTAAASTTATRSRSAIKYASTSSSIWRMRARLLSAPRMSNGSRDCSLRNVSRIGLIQLNTPLPTWRTRQSLGGRLPTKSWPELRIRNAAARTRIVSGGWLWPGRRESSCYFKYMACARIPEFESYDPSHTVVSSAVITAQGSARVAPS
jgi:hypothetical protein